MALYNFRKIDTTTKEGKAKLIDTFIDRIYLYDDHIKIIYNINGKDEEISLDELESSKGPQSGQPKRELLSKNDNSSHVFLGIVITKCECRSKNRAKKGHLGPVWD